MEDFKYIISDKCPTGLCQNIVVEKWKRFLEDCHLDYKVKYIAANDDLKNSLTLETSDQSLKDCPEIDFVMPQIDTNLRIRRVSKEELKRIWLK